MSRVFIGRCKSCNQIVAASTKGESLAEWLQIGLAVDLVGGPVSVAGCAKGCPEAYA